MLTGEEFVADLLTRLSVCLDFGSIEALLSDLDHHIHTTNNLADNNLNISSQNLRSLSNHGRQLWNTYIKEKRKFDDASMPGPRSRLFTRIKVLAFFTHVLARQNNRKAQHCARDDVVYLMGMALSVVKSCITEDYLEGARFVLHRVADYVEQMKATKRDRPESIAEATKFEAEYLTLRTALVGPPSSNCRHH